MSGELPRVPDPSNRAMDTARGASARSDNYLVPGSDPEERDERIVKYHLLHIFENSKYSSFQILKHVFLTSISR